MVCDALGVRGIGLLRVIEPPLAECYHPLR